MTDKRLANVIRRLKAVPPIAILGNVIGASLLFVYFAVLEPGAGGVEAWDLFRSRLTFFLVVFLLMVLVIVPINLRLIFLPLLRDYRKLFPVSASGRLEAKVLENLRFLASKTLNLPLKAAVTISGAWIFAGVLFLFMPRYFPRLFPWEQALSHKFFFGILFVAAPVIVTLIYLMHERLLRSILVEFFPHEALMSVPGSFKINVLPRILAVTLIVGIMPVSLLGHEVLRGISEIQAGRMSIEIFLSQMPALVIFLLVMSISVGVGLSALMAHSFSDPLKSIGAAMALAGKGASDVSVPVVSHDEIGSISEEFNRMLVDQRRLEALKDTFGRYLSEDVISEILNSPDGVKLGGELREITILVADLRGFTSIVESLEPHRVLEIINRYFERMTDIIMAHEGTIDEFTGDGLLVFFGAPRPMVDHPRRAVACAREMQAAMENLNRENDGLGLPELTMGIGINSGELIVGNIGSEKRKKYGAVGSPINVAFRVESQTPGGEIFITQTVHERLIGELEIASTREVNLKGFSQPMTLYQVVGMCPRVK
jgi:adenylate cyclase